MTMPTNTAAKEFSLYVSDASRCWSSSRFDAYREGWLQEDGDVTGDRRHARRFTSEDEVRAHAESMDWHYQTSVVIGAVSAFACEAY